MRSTTIALILACAPGYLAAQTGPAGQSESRPASPAQSASGFSAETRVRLEAMFRIAREKNLPTEPMADRMAEGQAKGASEAQILAATQQVAGQLAASHDALVRAGRAQPSDAEVERGAQLIARGASSAQLEALVQQNQSEHRLEVAFQVLSDLAARGIPVDRALAVVGAELNGSASAQAGRPVTGSSESPAAGIAGTLTSRVGVGLTRKP
jgi:hypothetical protein